MVKPIQTNAPKATSMVTKPLRAYAGCIGVSVPNQSETHQGANSSPHRQAPLVRPTYLNGISQSIQRTNPFLAPPGHSSINRGQGARASSRDEDGAEAPSSSLRLTP